MLKSKKATASDVYLRRFPVIPLGFEPKTHSLEGCCSIQLSYGTEPGARRTKERVPLYSFEPEKRRNPFILFFDSKESSELAHFVVALLRSNEV